MSGIGIFDGAFSLSPVFLRSFVPGRLVLIVGGGSFEPCWWRSCTNSFLYHRMCLCSRGLS